MSIKENWPKIKYQVGRAGETVRTTLPLVGRNDIFLLLTILLFGALSFGLGKLSMTEKGKKAITFETTNLAAVQAATPASSKTTDTTPKGLVVAARTGKNYYYPTCSGANRIAEKNKVWFDTIEEARAKGYTPSSTCKGLK